MTHVPLLRHETGHFSRKLDGRRVGETEETREVFQLAHLFDDGIHHGFLPVPDHDVPQGRERVNVFLSVYILDARAVALDNDARPLFLYVLELAGGVQNILAIHFTQFFF